ncbi:MAG: DUF1573 domain-containing protein, partial [Candidatus Azambacteria bacterium]|nr:DUF1573 domain-containing protein [Candidatus Azambacteria bacterium]
MKEQIKQILALLGIIAVVITGLVWFTNGSKKTPTAAIGGEAGGALTVQESKYDFGTVSMAKGKVSKDFLLENKSAGDVNIGEVFTSCMCTEAELSVGSKSAGPFGMQGHGLTRNANLVVKSGETLTVKTIFDPTAHGPSGVGPIQRQIVINTGDSQ